MKSLWPRVVIPGLWAGALGGLLAGGWEIWSQQYLPQRLWLNALRVLAPGLWVQIATALAAFAAVAAVALVSGSSCRRLVAAAGATILFAAWVATTSPGGHLLLPTARLERRLLAADLVLAAAILLFSRARSARPRRPMLLAFPPLALAIAAIIGHRGLDTERASAARQHGRPNVLVLLVDALRADHVGAYGYRRATTPAIDRLAAQGALFRRAMSPSNTTRTSMPSIWTGLLPSRHGVFLRGSVLQARFVTAAELLREAGYRTGAWCPNPSLDRSFGEAQGWDVYDDDFLMESTRQDPSLPPWEQEETAAQIQARFLAWLDRDPRRPFLAWLHYRDAHSPYVPPPPYDRFFRPETRRPLTPEERASAGPEVRLPDDVDDLEHYVARYDGEIRYVDDRIAELLQDLERRGLRKRTTIVVTADHGEGFLEHGFWGHGASLYEELLHVPLIVAVPGASPVTVEHLVSTLDLFPTILDLAAVDTPPNDGLSLVHLLRGEPDGYARTEAFAMALGKKRAAGAAGKEGSRGKAAEGRPPKAKRSTPAKGKARLRSVRRGDWKLIVDERTGRRELFDLGTDRAETIDRFDSDPEVARRLLDSLDAVVAATGGANAPEVELSPELAERLRSLGYTQ